ncbi:MAG: tetratricopeptide repeat protein [Acidobacteria bacterium]|nr:MAG: tetratricopeptide repeat protein [Acidobacteriota bacterium]
MLALTGLTLVAALTTLVGLDVGGWRGWLSQVVGVGGAPRIQSIAVLPFENLSGDPEQEYFAAGMHEALITDLAKLSGFQKVIARSSVMRYRDTDKSLPEIAQELGVDAVITGSVFREGDRVRITAQLIKAATEEHLWAERYERELRDVLSLQNEIVVAITREINLQLTPQEEARLASTRPVNPEAYEAYLKGRVHWYRQSPEQLETALEYFELALQKDPNYALAYAGIADTRFARGFRGVAPPREALPKAKAAALKAVELDDTLAEAHGVLANARYWYEWDWAGAETEFRRAIELNPNYPDARIFYSRFLTAMRRPEEAMAEIRRALELDPFNYLFQYVYGLDLLDMRRYDDAVAQFRKTLRTEPNFPWAHRGLWLAFHQKRMYEEALAAAEKHFALMGKSEVAEALERGYAQAGYPGAMSLAGETLAARSNVSYVPAGWIAELYAYAGEKEQALEWLEKAYEEHDPFMVELFVGSSWDGLRDYAPFQDLLRRMG